jgi:5-methylcytosine-specific restriction protein A
MPTAPPGRCTYPGCGTPTTLGRCPRHTRRPWEQPSANTRALTGRERAELRRRQLRREPQCRTCGSTTNLEADHITPIAAGGSLFNPENLQTLCDTHHKAKTAAEGRSKAAQRRF